MSEIRIVCGAHCSWWDSIDKVGRTAEHDGISIPACPHCGGVLFEFPNEAAWWEKVDHFERVKPSPGYRAFIEWLRGKCFPHYAAAKAVYESAPTRQEPEE